MVVCVYSRPVSFTRNFGKLQKPGNYYVRVIKYSSEITGDYITLMNYKNYGVFVSILAFTTEAST